VSGRSIVPAAAPGPDEVLDDAAVSAAGSSAAAEQGGAGLFDVVPAPPAAARDAAMATRAGTLVARGADVVVESVPDGSSSVFRVTISAGPYVVRDMPAIVSVDGVAVGIGAESVDLGSLVLFSSDPRLVTDGAAIAVSYGLPGSVPADWSTTLEVVQ
jgi:hypothetical protein